MEEKQAPYLITWYPEWDDEEHSVSDLERAQLRNDLRRFLTRFSDGEVFRSEIPFQIAGFVYGREGFNDGEGVITSPVKEIRRINEHTGTSPMFEITTQNTTYAVVLKDAAMICT